MRVEFTERFIASYIAAPPEIHKAFGKQLALLLRDYRHPSLQAKKYDAQRWQARVTQDWRFYYRPDGDKYYLLDIIPHPK
ncbi:MAG: hypothetical protein IT294_02880 [Deltaproteobacteria bacterium]|nr:hypothetical protein [Deltaproteobacteria bacterium]